ncbi:PTS system fructose-specific transporter subunit IIBC [Escherichia coli]|uniref:PTS system fructose-specific transporter subunit IIBC n=1 Tax=Escherichia coli TaxID=562 RepID=A0AAX2K8R2_ECOLX|nr:PTS system fructose-specific transporter subunit IIBC [Escherichia coli]
MKTLLIIDANLGQARAYMAKTLLGAAARKSKTGNHRQSERRRNGDCSR